MILKIIGVAVVATLIAIGTNWVLDNLRLKKKPTETKDQE